MNRWASFVVAVLGVTGGGVAVAGETSFGVLAGLNVDLPDKVSGGQTRFGPGGGMTFPVRARVNDLVVVRSALRLDAATGHDRVTWQQPVGTGSVRMSSDDHWTLLTSAAVTIGGELKPQVDWYAVPFGGLSLGGAWVGNWHSFGVSDSGVDTRPLVDPNQNDPLNGKNIDPWSSSFAILAELHLGVAFPIVDQVELLVETGYGGAFVPEAPLRKSPEDLNARRSAFVWNPVRIQVGFAVSF
jgi:hypothetical protein